MKGYLISVEGSDGSGKSTQLQNIIAYLEQKNVDLVVTREPGGTALSEAIRGLLLDARYTEMTAKTEMLLYAASRAQHIEQKIIPALEAGKVVVTDRFTDSSIAYQAYGRGLGDMVTDVNEIATGGCKPDLTIFLDLPPEQGILRKKQEQLHIMDRLELEKLAFHEKVYAGYQALLQKEPNRICRIDASQSIETVFVQIRKQLDFLLGF